VLIEFITMTGEGKMEPSRGEEDKKEGLLQYSEWEKREKVQSSSSL